MSDPVARPPLPKVGLSTYVERARWGPWDEPVAFLTRTYLDAIARAGALPVLLPPVVPDDDADLAAADLVDGVDALVITGGPDVDPARYGAAARPETDEPRAGRDGWEIALLRAALAAGTPVLAICRGTQVLNVAHGGTLHQHLPARTGATDHRPAPGTFGRVHVEVEAGSRLAGIVGTALDVPCSHHQAVDRVGDGLRVTARAEDGTIEAIEPAAGAAFVLGVQWHPEEDTADPRLFEALVAAARTGEPAGRAPAP